MSESEQLEIQGLVKKGEKYEWGNLIQNSKYLEFINTSEKHKESFNNYVKRTGEAGLQHVSIVLLKSRDGSQIQQIIEKSGKTMIDIQGYPSRKGAEEFYNLPMYEEAAGNGNETQYLSSEEE